MSLLEVENLKIRFDSRRGRTEAVKGISFEIREGESVAIVGESGSGKSVTAMSLMRLLPPPPLCSVSGSIKCSGLDVVAMDEKTLRKFRGGKIAYIFQEPSTSFNPLFTVGSQIAEAVKLHSPRGTDVEKAVADSLAEVGIRDAALRARSYPYEMSGGMLQRAMIAMALACRPKLLVADEPTTALDVTIQKQVIDLLARVRTDYVHQQQERYRAQVSYAEDALATAEKGNRVKLEKRISKLNDQLREASEFEEKVHHLADQMIEIDLDDGVKVNYAKFQDVLAKIK